MRRVLTLAGALLVGAEAVSAATNCPGANHLPDSVQGRGSVYYILQYLGPESGVLKGENGLDAMEEGFSEVFGDRLRDTVGRLKIAKPNLLIISCPNRPTSTDLNQEDMTWLWNRAVIGVLWSNSGSNTLTVVSTAMMERSRILPRQDVEVVMPIHSGNPPIKDLQGWIDALRRSPASQSTFIDISIGFEALLEKRFALAKLSLCQARASLKQVHAERPPALLGMLNEAIDAATQDAKASGADLDGVPAIQTACHLTP